LSGKKNKKQATWACFLVTLNIFLQNGYVVRLRSFLTLYLDEGNLLAFLQGLESIAVDGTEMNKQIAARIPLNKAISLSLIEPLYGSFLLL
jgi:hypothetical protein